VSDEFTLEALLAEAAWLRRLALTLARDEDEAADLVQETWIAAWKRRPDTRRPVKPWLAKVARDLLRMRRRSVGRRRVREAAARDDRDVARPDTLLEQVRLQRLLAGLVLELDEPFRATILARFFEGQTSAAIARGLGVPEATVRSRLREGLARLRAGLDSRTGDRKAWAPAVLLLHRRGEGTKLLPVGIGLAALLAAAGIVILMVRSSPERHAGERPRDGRPPVRGAAVQPEAQDPVATLALARPPGWLAQEGAPSRHVAGRVLVDGVPVAGARVRLTSEASRTGLVPASEQRTTGDGRFDFGARVAARYAIGAAFPGRVATVEHVDLRDPTTRADELVLVLDPCLAGLHGRVLDPGGSPIAHAELLTQGVIGTAADAAGAFDICLPAQGSPDDLRLVVSASGYGSVELIPRLSVRARHDFVLTPEAVVAGRAIDARGQAVAFAAVRLEWDEAASRPGSEHPSPAQATTDADGRFEVGALASGRRRVHALARGLVAEPMVVDVLAGVTQQITIAMSDLGVVRGRVLLDGEPVGGVTVSNRADLPTYEQRAPVSAPVLEAVSQLDGSFVLDGLPPGDVVLAAAPYRLRTPVAIRVVAGEQDVTLEVEALGEIAGVVRHRGDPAPRTMVWATGRHWLNKAMARTDEAGRFRLRGLDADDYQLSARNVSRGAGARDEVTVHVDGADRREVVIELHDEAHEDGNRATAEVRTASITGLVVDAAGEPIADARVFAVTGADEWTPVPATVTSTDGGFELGELAEGDHVLHVAGPDGAKTTAMGISTGSRGVRIQLDGPSCAGEPATGPSQHPAHRVVWDDRIELIGWEVPRQVRAGADFEVALWFKVLRPVARSWQLFVHVDGPRLRVNADHEPLGGRCPTAMWKPGDVLVDRFIARMVPETGSYEVWTGFFAGREPNWQHLPVTQAPREMQDAHARIKLTTITVE
jgi:RNA polymerase sigma-70 factor (ECF subfamily)